MCAECDWITVFDRIKDLMDTGKFGFAQQTLEGIAEWIEEHQHVTDNQRAAVERIAESKGY